MSGIGLTRRQAAGLAVAAALGAVTVAAALLGWMGLAVAALGLTGVLLAVGMVQLRRRVAQAHQATQQLTQELRHWRRRSDSTHRRVRDALAQERRVAAGRHRELRRCVDGARQATDTALHRMGWQLVRRQRDQTQELEAVAQLFRGFAPRAPMPSSGHWALNPTDLLELRSVIDRVRPKLVLELGSGASTIWIGYALEPYHGRLVSVDHDPEYAEQTRAQLRRHDLTGVAEVRHALLSPTSVDGEEFRWYDPAAFTDLSGVDLLVVDGPPGDTGPRARYPALPLLAGRLAPGATVVLDDADRRDESEILRQWTGTADGPVPEPATVGHLAVLTYRQRQSG